MQGLGEDLNPIEVAERAGLTPLTGRDHEVSLLKDRWEQAQEGMGQVVLLIGEPGLGKSRLVYTIKRHVREQAGDPGEAAQGSPVIEWRCSPHYRNSSLYPVGEFFERFLGFGRDEAGGAVPSRRREAVRPEARPARAGARGSWPDRRRRDAECRRPS